VNTAKTKRLLAKISDIINSYSSHNMIIKTLAVSILTILLCSTVHADTVFKWDENGKTIYSQTPPPPGVEYEVITDNKKSTTNTGTEVANASANSSGDALKKSREDRAKKKTEKAVLAESNQIKEENCGIAKKNMESLNSHGQVTVKEGDVYRKLSEEERQTRIQDTQAQMDEFCQS